MNRKTEIVKTATPWGKSQHVTRFATGVNFYSTAGHGGFKLSTLVNNLIPNYFKDASLFNKLGWRGWYEEDCDAAIVIVILASWPGYGPVFTEQEIRLAHKNLKAYLPAEYARFLAESPANTAPK
jgi:hypothetical protein